MAAISRPFSVTGMTQFMTRGYCVSECVNFEWPVVDNCGEIMLEFGWTYQIARTTGSVGIQTAWRRVREDCAVTVRAPPATHTRVEVSQRPRSHSPIVPLHAAPATFLGARSVVVAIVVAAAFHLSRTRCTSRDVRYASGRGQVAIVPGLARGLIRAAAARPDQRPANRVRCAIQPVAYIALQIDGRTWSIEVGTYSAVAVAGSRAGLIARVTNRGVNLQLARVRG